MAVRSTERDVLLLVLAVSAGSADGWSYFGLGHAFVANMTGNTVLLGLAVFQNHGDMLHPFISLVCYLAGTAVAALINRKVQPGSMWSSSISWTLLLEALILSGAEAAWIMIHRGMLLPELNLLLGVVAFAIGMQSGAMVQLKIPGVVTTYITGTWTTLISGVTRLATQKPQGSEGQKLEFEKRLFMQAGVVAAYFLAAVLAGWLFRYSPSSVGAVSAASVLFAALYSAFRSPGATP
jgi:uncharacterized membrane protein YoaK (UPF0700 family)